MLYLSSSCLKREKISDSVSELSKAGVTRIELSGGTRRYDGVLRDISALKEKFGLDFLVHGYFPPPEDDFILDLIAPDETGKKRMLAFIKESVDFCRAVGVGVYSTHPGFTVDVACFFDGAPSSGRPDVRKQDAEKIFYRNIEDILGVISGSGVGFAVENMYPLGGRPESAMLSEPDEIAGFLEYSKRHPALGFLLDLGHLNVSAKLLGYNPKGFAMRVLEDYPDKVFELHASENSGFDDDHGITGEDSWQMDVLYAAHSGKIPVVFEWRSGDPRDVLKRFREISETVNKQYREA